MISAIVALQHLFGGAVVGSLRTLAHYPLHTLWSRGGKTGGSSRSPGEGRPCQPLRREEPGGRPSVPASGEGAETLSSFGLPQTLRVIRKCGQ